MAKSKRASDAKLKELYYRSLKIVNAHQLLARKYRGSLYERLGKHIATNYQVPLNSSEKSKHPTRDKTKYYTYATFNKFYKIVPRNNRAVSKQNNLNQSTKK